MWPCRVVDWTDRPLIDNPYLGSTAGLILWRRSGTATFLVKVKAHRGELANEGVDILADKAISNHKVGKECCQRTNRAVFTWKNPCCETGNVVYLTDKNLIATNSRVFCSKI